MSETRATYTTNIEPAPRSDRSELLAIADALDAMRDRAQQIRQEMQTLEAQGMTNATIFWDKDRDGQRTLMKLIHPTEAATGHRRREYVGKDPQRQAEAQARLERWEKYQELKREVEAIEGQLLLARSSIDTLKYRILAEQKRLPGFNGD